MPWNTLTPGCGLCLPLGPGCEVLPYTCLFGTTLARPPTCNPLVGGPEFLGLSWLNCNRINTLASPTCNQSVGGKAFISLQIQDCIQAFYSIVEIKKKKKKKKKKTQKIDDIIRKFEQCGLVSPKDADGMANSADPDQDAPSGSVRSGSTLSAQTWVQLITIFFTVTDCTVYWSENFTEWIAANHFLMCVLLPFKFNSFMSS